jgi:hypothetical protein
VLHQMTKFLGGKKESLARKTAFVAEANDE